MAEANLTLSAEQTLELFERAESAWLEEFQEPVVKLENAENPGEMLRAIPEERLEMIASKAVGNILHVVATWLDGKGVKRSANPDVCPIETEAGKRLSREIAALRSATDDLRARGIPDGAVGQMIRGAKTAMKESDHSWVYAIPKLGWLAGTVQGARSALKLSKEDQQYTDAFKSAVASLKMELRSATPVILSLCLQQLAGPGLVLEITLAEAKSRLDMLDNLADKIVEADPADSAEWMRLYHITSAEVARLSESPLANHLHGMVLHQLGRTDEAILYAWNAATKNLEAIGLWTNLASYLVEAKRNDEASEVGGYLRAKWPDEEEAAVSAARCLCLNEQFDEADELLQSLAPGSSDEAGVLLLSVEVATGKADTNQAAIRFRKLAETCLVSVDWLSHNSESPVFGAVLSHDLLKPIYGSKGEAFDHKQAIGWFLSPHKPKDFFIAPRLPDKMLQGAAETFLKGVPRDEIVCFIDNTFWDTGKNGIALTKNAIRWKAMLGGGLMVKYAAITSLGMELDGARIVFGMDKQQRELTCHSEEFAMGMYRYLSAAAYAFR